MSKAEDSMILIVRYSNTWLKGRQMPKAEKIWYLFSIIIKLEICENFIKLDTHTLIWKGGSRTFMYDSHIKHNADGETSIKPLFNNIMTKGGIIIGTFCMSFNDMSWENFISLTGI